VEAGDINFVTWFGGSSLEMGEGLFGCFRGHCAQGGRWADEMGMIRGDAMRGS
jgi:hypothetical protein